MRKQLNRGASNMEGILILIVLIAIVLISPRGTFTANESGSDAPRKIYSPAISTISGAQSASLERNARIRLGRGNASSEYQPYKEYITIANSGRDAVDLAGWTLKNGKDKRPYSFGGNLQRFSADIAALPRLILGPSEKAIITTGRVNVQLPYRIESVFRENACTGYLEALDDYAFTPPLKRSCPRPSEEPGLENLDVECRDFVKSLSSCKTPKFTGKDKEGNSCSTCLDGQILSSQCAAFIKERFNYKGCLANHSLDPNFQGKTWRVFLGRGWEMWAKKYESIELYDLSGNLVDFENY